MSKPRDERMQAKWLRVFVAGVYAFLFAPIVVLVLFSFNDSKRNAAWRGFTTKWYVELINDQPVLDALWKTMQIAITATILATIFGSLAAYALTRYRFRGPACTTGRSTCPWSSPRSCSPWRCSPGSTRPMSR